MDDPDARGAAAAPTARRSFWRGPLGVVTACVVALVVAVAVCETMGWPFLAGLVQREMGKALDRPVAFSEDPAASPRITIHLLGHLRVAAPYLRIGAPPWSSDPHMLIARDARLTMAYLDLWRASRGEPLRIRELRASRLDGHFERLADGRASWQFGRTSSTPDPNAAPTRLPTIDLLQVDAGRVDYRDAPLATDLSATFSLVDSSVSATRPAASAAAFESSASAAALSSASAGAPPSSASPAAPARSASAVPGLQLQATGHYRKVPMQVELKTSGVLPVMAADAAAIELPVTLRASAGGARLTFNGTATDAVNLGALKGRFSVQGPSLDAIGDPLHVTLPKTGPFKASGLVAKTGVVWNVVAQQLDVGTSRLDGAFTYDPRPVTPVLSGRLNGSRLALADLGPAVGAPSPSAPTPVASAPGRVLPDRPFDLPSLRAMDANVLIDIADLDLGSSILEPLKPLRTHLVLAGGVLQLRDLDARTGQGRLAGLVQLDGRNAQALWTADLRWAGVRLESWIHQKRKAADAPPYVTGN
ncbi:MAG TPA: AsmA family protein, partial [Burkholderiaceae bacterium]